MSYLKGWSEDVDRVVSARHERPFYPRLTFRRASEIPLTDGETRAAIEMAYRRGFDQGSYIAGDALEMGVYDRWRQAITQWRYRYRSTRRFESPPEPESYRTKGDNR